MDGDIRPDAEEGTKEKGNIWSLKFSFFQFV